MKNFRKFLLGVSVPYGLFFLILFLYNSKGQAQPPICRITDFSSSVKAVSIGPYGPNVNRCLFWFNSPAPGQVQIECFSAPNQIVVKNEVDVPTLPGFPGGWVFPDGQITWTIKTGEFHLVGAGSDGIEVSKDGTF